MLVPDPIYRITVLQIKNHPWLSKFSDSLTPYNRTADKINRNVIRKCLALENFSNLTEDQAIQTLKHSPKNDFSVSYNIILDLEKKVEKKCEQFQALLVRRFRKLSIGREVLPYKAPNNWVYGLRWHSKAIILMERLFVALKENDLEWRIIDNFSFRVRPCDNSNKHIRFDIKIYKVCPI